MRGYRVLLTLLIICLLSTPYLVKAQNAECLLNLPTRFVQGMRGKLSAQGQVSRTITIRRQISSESNAIGILRPDDTFTASGEVGCSERMYWQSIVTDNGLSGFVAESDRNDYFIEPISREIYRFGHGKAYGISWSPDSKMMAIGSTLGIWLYTDRLVPVRLLPSYDDGVRAIAWSPDGRKIASANSDKTVQLWDVVSGKSVTLLRNVNHNERNNWWDGSVTWSPDSTKFASAGLDGTVRIWDAKAEKQLTVLYEDYPIYYVAWHPNGKWLASGSRRTRTDDTGNYGQGMIVIWNVTSGKQVKSLIFNEGDELFYWFVEVNNVQWVGNSDVLAIDGGESFTWNTVTGKTERLYISSPGGSSDVGFWYSPDGKRLAGASSDGTVWMSDAMNVPLSEGIPTAAQWSNDSKLMAVVFQHGSVVITNGLPLSDGISAQVISKNDHFKIPLTLSWSTVEGQEVVSVQDQLVNVETGKTFVPGTTAVPTATPFAEVMGYQFTSELAFNADKTQFAILFPFNTIMMYNAARNAAYSSLDVDPQFGIKLDYSYIASASWSPDGNYIAVTDKNITEDKFYLVVWDTKTVKTKFAVPVKPIKDSRGDFIPVRPLWSPDSTRILLDTPQIIVDLSGNTLFNPNAKSAMWLSDSNRILTNNTDKALFSIQDINSGAVHQSIRGAFSQLSDNKKYGAFTGNQRNIQIWDMNKEQQLITLGGLTAPATIMAWQPDNKRLAVASEDNTIRIWDVTTGDLVLTIGAHRLPIRSMVWKSDGTQLYTTSDDGTLRLWDVR